MASDASYAPKRDLLPVEKFYVSLWMVQNSEFHLDVIQTRHEKCVMKKQHTCVADYRFLFWIHQLLMPTLPCAAVASPVPSKVGS